MTGLHDQFDVDLRFNPGLNIIYGKNGRGKTTILHLLANILELDFQRFAFLQFHEILVENCVGERVSLSKPPGERLPHVFVNESRTSFGVDGPTFSDAEAASIRAVLGGRSTYLPAFRSVLERTRADTAYHREMQRREDVDKLAQQEYEILRDAHIGPTTPLFNRSLQNEASSIAQKTFLCRQWFGSFVPVVRYPSVADVEDSLSDEWRKAQSEVGHREQSLFEETFLKIFRTIAGLEKNEGIENNENLLSSIARLVEDEGAQIAGSGSRDIYNNLVESARSMRVPSVKGYDNSLLEIYRQMLEKRNTERKRAFEKTREFETSVNKFLDNKKLSIGGRFSERTRSAISVVTEDGHAYGLSALSSGERQILTMLYSASRTRALSGVFLIDEPELSLHIDWQRMVLSELRRQSSGRQIIACTHSPEVGADNLENTQDFEPNHTATFPGDLFEESAEFDGEDL